MRANAISRLLGKLKIITPEHQNLIESYARMEELLQNRTTLEEIGLLAGSLEHDIKTPLGIIQSEIFRMKHRFQSNEEIIAGLERIEQARHRIYEALRIISMVRADEDYYVQHMSRTSLTDLVNRCIKAVKSERPENVFFRFRYGRHDRPFFVKTYAPMLEQAIVNIFKNSIEAIACAKRQTGVIDIRLRALPRANSRASVESEDRVTLEIEDNGGGIPEEDLVKLSALLFSNKSGKPNRGLGLFVAKRIFRIHDSVMNIRSRFGEGTVVSIAFPVAREKPDNNSS